MIYNNINIIILIIIIIVIFKIFTSIITSSSSRLLPTAATATPATVLSQFIQIQAAALTVLKGKYKKEEKRMNIKLEEKRKAETN